MRFVASSQKVCAEYKMDAGDNLIIKERGKIVVDGVGLISNVSNLHSGVMIDATVSDVDEVSGEDSDDYKKSLEMSYKTKYDEVWEHSHNLLNPVYFPDIDFAWDTKHMVAYPAGRFIKFISRAASAASDEQHRPSYNAVMVSFGSKGVEFFASDGRQMAYVNDSSLQSSNDRQALVQSQVISKVTKKGILETGDDVEISISTGEKDEVGKVRFYQNGLTIITNFAQGANVLPYDKILALQSDVCSFNITAELLKEDLKVFSDLENKDSKWTFGPDGIKVVSLGNFDRKSEGKISGVKDYIGDECTMRLSLRYWDSLLSQCDGDTELKVSVAHTEAPIGIEVSPEPSLYKFFIMPMNDVND
ncbi:MAG: hypothetical protein ACOCV1_08345 [Bacillota bacterium]